MLHALFGTRTIKQGAKLNKASKNHPNRYVRDNGKGGFLFGGNEMIDISKREEYELKLILEEIEQGGELAITNETGGHELTRLQTSLIVDILDEYVWGRE